MSHSLVPLIPTPQSMDRDAEIVQINRELEILCIRHALYRRMGAILKVYFIAITPLFAIAALALAIKFILLDTLSGAFFAGVLLIFDLVIFLLIRESDLRWIDVASQFPRATNPYFYTPTNTGLRFFILGRLPSEAQIIEQQIADRERRLSELGVSIPGANKID